ncbi:unnamed protein product [Ophioblennius macclurei]
MIKSQLEPLFRALYPFSFLSLDVVQFSPGSIVNHLNMRFETPSAPTSVSVGNSLMSLSSNVTGFDIEGSSITVNSTIVTSPASAGVHHHMDFITALCFAALSWLLSTLLSTQH